MVEVEYKKGCNFRNKIQVCNFKAEDCRPEKCDMFDIKWTLKSVDKVYQDIRKRLLFIQDEIKVMKKNGEKKTNPEKYKLLKQERFDNVKGGIYMSRAFERLKREGRR